MAKRSCDSCTKCCEGNVYGEVHGDAFYKGRPCSFIDINKGCSIHSSRPVDPCQEYECLWLSNNDIPLWMKPDKVNAIFSKNQINGIDFITLVECDEVMRSDVLSWAFLYVINNGINFCWQVRGGFSWIGSPEFNEHMSQTKQGAISFPM